MAISKKTWTGIAREATPGTAITTPTVYIPTKTTFKGGKKRVYLDEERGDRNDNYGVVDSIRQTALDFKGPWYNDVSPYLLIGAFGLDTPTQPAVSTDPTVWSHAISLADVPPSFTVMRSLDAKTYYVPYTVVEKFGLQFSSEGKLLECNVSAMGMFAQPQNTPPTPSYSSLLPFAGYLPTITLNGTASSDIIDLDFEFTQKVTLWYPANGSQDYITAYFGARSAKVNFTARFDNTTIYDRWRNNVNDSVSIVFTGPIISHTYAQSLTLNCPVITYDDVEHDTSKDNVMIKAKATVLAQTTQFVSATVQNTVASYTV